MENPCLMILDFNGAFMSICETKDQVDPRANYWFPLNQAARFEFWKKLNKIQIVENEAQLSKLVEQKIVIKL